MAKYLIVFLAVLIAVIHSSFTQSSNATTDVTSPTVSTKNPDISASTVPTNTDITGNVIKQSGATDPSKSTETTTTGSSIVVKASAILIAFSAIAKWVF